MSKKNRDEQVEQGGAKESKKSKGLPSRIWLTSNNLDVEHRPGELDDFWHPIRASAVAEAKRMTDDGYPSHVVGPYVLAPNGRRHV